MINMTALAIDACCAHLRSNYSLMFGDWNADYMSIAVWVAHMALENIANGDCLYHDVEHTIHVTVCGVTILHGRHISEGGVTPHEWLNFVVAALCHDIGYIRGILRADARGRYATGKGNAMVNLGVRCTDAHLTQYHVDRSKAFVMERFAGHETIDPDTVVAMIEMTRFPVPKDGMHDDVARLPGLLRAADLIGQLGDPRYLLKQVALFYEFEQTGANRVLGYTAPSDLKASFARFFWTTISPFIGPAQRYLKVTQEGKQWLARLHAHIFEADMERQRACRNWNKTLLGLSRSGRLNSAARAGASPASGQAAAADGSPMAGGSGGSSGNLPTIHSESGGGGGDDCAPSGSEDSEEDFATAMGPREKGEGGGEGGGARTAPARPPPTLEQLRSLEFGEDFSDLSTAATDTSPSVGGAAAMDSPALSSAAAGSGSRAQRRSSAIL